MEQCAEERSRELLTNLRRIIQAIGLHSRQLSKRFGLTGPQLVILQELSNRGPLSVSKLSRAVSLSQGTVTDIVSRLEKKSLLERRRSTTDKRRVMVSLTESARHVLEHTPSPLQDRFLESFSRLEDWEQLMILACLNRIVSLMEAKEIDAAPFLISGPIQSETAE